MSDPVSQNSRPGGASEPLDPRHRPPVRPRGPRVTVARSLRLARSLRRGGLAGVAMLLLASATAWAYTSPWAGWKSAGGNIGHIAIGGPLKGTKTLPKGWTPPYTKLVSSTCRFTSDGPTSLQFWLYNVKFSLKGHQRTIDSILVSLSVSRDGNTETLAPTGMAGSANLYEATTNLTAGIGRTNYSWSSNSGSVKTSPTGKSGSLQGVLPPAPVDRGAATGNLSLKLSWSNCQAFRRP
jgi:hypothetical protein